MPEGKGASGAVDHQTPKDGETPDPGLSEGPEYDNMGGMEALMRKSRFAAIAAAVVLAATLSAAEKRALGKFKETSWDFGKIKQGEVLAHDFVFTNEGEGPLVIERIASTCGCTAALASEDKIGPGKTGKINVTFDSRGYSGKIVKYIHVESNDSEDPSREIRIEAEIEVPPQPRIDLDRYTVDPGLSLQGEESSAKVVVRNIGELELKVEASHTKFTFFVDGKPAAFPLAIASGKSAAIEIRFPGAVETGALRDYVLFKSNDPLRSTVSIYVSRYVITKAELKALFNKYRKLVEGRD